MEVRVQAPSGSLDATFLAGAIEAFHAAHARTFGYATRRFRSARH